MLADEGLGVSGGRPEIAPLLHYSITSRLTSPSWLPSAASGHRRGVMGREQLNAATVSRTTRESAWEAP